MSTPYSLRIAASFTLLFALSIALLGWIMGNNLETSYTQDLRERLAGEAQAIALSARETLTTSQPLTVTQALAQSLGTDLNARVTFISADNKGLGDSDGATALTENFSTRPEVQQVVNKTAFGVAERPSATLNIATMYVAVPVQSTADPAKIAAIVRVGYPLTYITDAKQTLWRNLAIMLALLVIPVIVVAVLLARSIGQPLRELGRVARRLGSGDLSQRAPVAGGRDLAQLATDFNLMADRLSDTIKQRTYENNQISAVLDNMTDAIITTNNAGIVTDANPAALRFFGGGRSSNRTLIEVTHEHELHLALKRVLAAPKRPENLEVSSSQRTLSATVTAVPAVDGGEVTGLVVLQDITELRRLERVRRDFVANISHELRTPLASIKLLAETLETSINDDPDEAHNFLQRIDIEIDRLTQLVRELLELSRIESGQVELQRHPVDPMHMLESAAARLMPQAERAGLNVLVEQPREALPQVYADSRAMEQVLVNLLHNAIKFTPPGGKIRLSAARQQNNVLFAVSDTGIGIDPDDLPRLFERFYKVDKARTGSVSREGGTGLGLAIAKHMVQAHGGGIWARSKLQQGSTFSFTLPLVRGQNGA